jgi:type I pantothenate kinase
VIAAIAQAVAALRPIGAEVFIVGLTGGVAAGKTTLAAALASQLDVLGEGPTHCASTDGFLRPNDELDAAGLTLRKGWPESYDHLRMARVLEAVRHGPARFPGYSHLNYDVDETSGPTLDRPKTLILEGLGFGHATPVDALIYLDAPAAELEGWYVERFVEFCGRARAGEASFYSRFADLDDAGAAAMARMVWRGVNLPNLKENLAPLRAAADLIVRKGPAHVFVSIERAASVRR